MGMIRRCAMGLVVGLVLGRGAVASAQAAASAGNPSPVRERISLDLKGVDILDVLKLLSQKSGFNLVAGKNVSGRVTIFVNDVDVWEAFELIVAANDLAYEQRGEIVTVMAARDYELLHGEKFQELGRSLVLPLTYAKAAQVATVLNQIKSSLGRVVADETTNTLIVNDVPSRLAEIREVLAQIDRPTDTRIYRLNYADAEKLKEKIQDLLSPVGTFTFDARTNQAAVSDLTEVLQKTDQLIRAFDVPEGQVLIEAKVITVELTDEMDLGIDWQRIFAGIDASVRNNFDVITGDVAGGSVTGAALKLVGSSHSGAQVVIEALKKVTKTDTISNPRIMVSNNQEAKILVGTREAIVTTTTTVPATGSTVAAPEIEFVDVGTKLYVTPNVKRDGHVQLKIRPEISTSKVEIFQSNRIPIVSSTEAETSVLVKSGSTLILGGLISTKEADTVSRVPGLGDLPILGWAFRGSTKTKTKTELVLFLTPQIVMPDGSAFVVPAAAASPIEDAVPVVVLRDPVPAGYRALIRRRLQAHLINRFREAALQRGSVVLSFVLNHDGTMVGPGDVASPQGEPFVAATRSALASAQPFPPFPDGSQADEVRFRLAVDYHP